MSQIIDKNANNLFVLDNKTSLTAICVSGNSFDINNKKYSVSEFNECYNQISGNVLNTNLKCSNGSGSLINIGFQLNDGRGFVNLIDVCYDKRKGSAIYTKHILQGNAIKNAMKSSVRPSTFKTAEVPPNIEASKSFTKANQFKRFQQVFDHDTAQEFLNKTYLARGHLSPDGDFIFVSWQFSTYYYINVVPQWQSINNANWKHVESAIRSKADKLKTDCMIYTGGFDVLKLNNKKISLEPDGLEVPKWSWKIVKITSDNTGIAFLTLNNPFATSKPKDLCQDICNDSGWYNFFYFLDY
jgi:DNA/RNA endonuclease G (NUC1)